MPILEAGSRNAGPRGFTLLELLVVLAIVAFASAGVSFALRDTSQARLEREAHRLSALLEAARMRSQVSALAVHWQPSPSGFVFTGLPTSPKADADLPQDWLDPDTAAQIDSGTPDSLTLGPEPIIAPQALTLFSRSQPEKKLRLGTDGVRAFGVLLETP